MYMYLLLFFSEDFSDVEVIVKLTKLFTSVINLCYTCFDLQSFITAQYLPQVYLPLGNEHQQVLASLTDIVRSLHSSPSSRMVTALLYGPKGE